VEKEKEKDRETKEERVWEYNKILSVHFNTSELLVQSNTLKDTKPDLAEGQELGMDVTSNKNKFFVHWKSTWEFHDYVYFHCKLKKF